MPGLNNRLFVRFSLNDNGYVLFLAIVNLKEEMLCAVLFKGSSVDELLLNNAMLISHE